MADCLFCNMASGAMEVDKLYEDQQLFAIRDIHPRAPVHFMVIPKEHIPTAADIEESHGPLLVKMMAVANDVAHREGIGERGYRLAVNVGKGGGQLIMHLHMHVLGGRHLGPEG